jgi:hypothetical protein
MAPKSLVVVALGALVVLGGCAADPGRVAAPGDARGVPAVVRVPPVPDPGPDGWGTAPLEGCFAPPQATIDAAAALSSPPDAMAAVPAYATGWGGWLAVASETDGRVTVNVVPYDAAGPCGANEQCVLEPLGHPQETDPRGFCGPGDWESCKSEWDAAEAEAKACLRGL